MSKTPVCEKCDRTYTDGEDGWLVRTDNGVPVGHLCPDHVTDLDHLEAQVEDAIRGPGRLVKPGDPEFKAAFDQHVEAVANDVWHDWLDKMASSNMTDDWIQDGRPNYGALADETLRRLRRTVGQPGDPKAMRNLLTEYFQEVEEEALRSMEDD